MLACLLASLFGKTPGKGLTPLKTGLCVNSRSACTSTMTLDKPLPCNIS